MTTERGVAGVDLREQILEAARDIVGEEGLHALSMRALAVRVGYSAATIYHHFQDKDELLRSVVAEGYRRLGTAVTAELSGLEGEVTPVLRLTATGRAYARFALEHTGYFRAMFEMPEVACVQGCPEPTLTGDGMQGAAVDALRRATGSGNGAEGNPERAMLVGWGLIHGLTMLYLSGHFAAHIRDNAEFMELIDSALGVLRAGWRAE